MLSRTTLEQQGRFDTWGDYIPSKQNSNDNKYAKVCWLNQFNALKVSGPDAERFLQGQLTCDISKITLENNLFGACCTAKGRTVANFNISFDGDSYWLILPSGSADILEKHLQKYKVFFKATITNCLDTHLVFGQWSDNEKGMASHQKGIHQLAISATRNFLIMDMEEAPEPPPVSFPTINWCIEDIMAGIHYITLEQSEKWIPQHINWHQLEGISFNKGCYTGQEIIARLQYLGKAKKAMYHYSLILDKSDTCAIESNVERLPLDLNIPHLFDKHGKIVGDVLNHRIHAVPDKPQVELLIVLNGETPDSYLYLTESKDFPLTLQNLPYTVEKEV